MFDIIICTYNGGNKIREVIHSIISQKDYDDLCEKLIIVNNNSTDNTTEILKELDCNISVNNLYVVDEPNPGLSNARLRGVFESNAKWIVFIDDDNVLYPDWLVNACEYINLHARIGAFIGVVMPRCDYELTNIEQINLSVAYTALACTQFSRELIDYEEHKAPIFGAGLVIRQKELMILADSGWLTAEGRKGNKLLSGEDSEMIDYVLSQGYEKGFAKKCKADHIIPRTRLETKYLGKLCDSFLKYRISSTDNRAHKLLIFLRMYFDIFVSNFVFWSHGEKMRIRTHRYNYKEVIKSKLFWR